MNFHSQSGKYSETISFSGKYRRNTCKNLKDRKIINRGISGIARYKPNFGKSSMSFSGAQLFECEICRVVNRTVKAFYHVKYRYVGNCCVKRIALV